MTAVRISTNSHIALMCATTNPVLCEKHLDEVRNDGDLIGLYSLNQPGPCTMCEIERPKRMDDPDSPFMELDRLRALFGSRPGSEIATKTTFVPTGKIVEMSEHKWLSVSGSRTFDASEFDYMEVWTRRHQPEDWVAIEIVERDLLRTRWVQHHCENCGKTVVCKLDHYKGGWTCEKVV